MGRVSLSVSLAAPAEAVWERAVTFDGVNDEFAPLLKMTMPRGLPEGATIADVEPGVPLGRSLLLLGGVLPVDWDDLCVAEIEAPRRFRERSTMASMTSWEHERVVEPVGEGACTVTDTLAFQLRRPMRWIPGSDRLAAAIVGRLFTHRHRRLARAHGAGAGT